MMSVDGSVCCNSRAAAVPTWSRSAQNLTSKVFSALKNIGGSFVAVEDGIPPSRCGRGFANRGDSELAEDACVIEDTPTAGVDRGPVVRLGGLSQMPVGWADRAADGCRRLSSDVGWQCTSSQYSEPLSRNSVVAASPEIVDRTTDWVSGDVPDDADDDNDNIVFSSGVRRKVHRNKGNRCL